MSKNRPSSASLLVAFVGSLVLMSLPVTAISVEASVLPGDLDPACLSHEPESDTIRLTCGAATLPLIHEILDDDSILSLTSERVWHLHSDIVVENGAHLSITGKDTDWLKLETPSSIISFGDVVIDSTRITSWDSAANTFAGTDGKRSRSFITAWDDGMGQLNITNSEIAYMGYHTSHKQGLAYYSGHGSVVNNNDIHHMWYGFYSNNVTGINIENNKIHDNVVYGLDPHTGTRDMTIRNNVVYNITKGIGIICSYDCDNILMENNVVYDVDIVGLMLSRNSTDSIIRNNIVYNSGTNGGGISVDDSSRNQVYNNTVSIGRFGIKISKNSDYNEIFDNTISNYDSYGICLIDGSDHNRIYKNRIDNVGEYGICTMRGASENISYENEIAGTGYYGIYVRDADAVGNQFRSNVVSQSNQNGVRVFNNTDSTFTSNLVHTSTKADYSLGGGKISIFDTAFTSAYFDGSGEHMTSEVSITNSDGRLVATDSAVTNTIDSDGRVTLNFALESGDRTVLNTLPFSAIPDVGSLEASFTEGIVQGNSPHLAWTEKTTSLTDVNVNHRLLGLKPGLDLKLAASDDRQKSEWIVGPDGILEFTSIQRPGFVTEYSLLPSGVADLGDSSDILGVFDAANNTGLRTYGCEIYASVVHCDPLTGDFVSYSVEGKFRTVQPLSSSDAAFVEGKFNDALKLSARYRESVEVMNTPILANQNFTISMWIQNSNEAEPYGHVISHVNFAGTAGWLVDMTSTTGSQPFDQRLQFGVTNRQGQLMAPTEVAIPQGRPVHVSGVFDGSLVKLYVDGRQVGEVTYRGEYNPDPGTPLRIGSASYSTSTHRWSGIIDEVAIYNRPLSSDEISRLAGQSEPVLSVGGDESQLVTHWSFDKNVEDQSGHGNDGNLSTLLSSMVFAPDGRLFFAEKNTGYIRIMQDDAILPEPFAFLPDVYVSWEQGLLGITLDPKFEENRYVYQYFTYMDPATGEVFNRLVRFTESNNKGTEMKVLIDKIPAVKGYHSGGALAFGPDEKLYVTVGDATEHAFAQDPNVLIGKVLRINRDGSIPSDNPDPTSPIFTKGHRNMFGLAFDTRGLGIITENGEAAYDEINIITNGGNYGFPTFQPANIAPELSDPTESIHPTRSYYETIAPTQALYYKGSKIPQLEGRFLFGTFTGDIYALKIDPTTGIVTAEERIELYPTLFTPVIGIAQAPNGDLYYGSYGIFKLDSLDLETRIPVSYPIRISSSEDVSVNNLKFDQDGKRIAIGVSIDESQTSGEPGAAVPERNTVSIKIPRILMDEITGVVSDADTTPLDFRVTSGGGSSSDGYNVVTVGLEGSQGDSNVSVIAARVIPEFSSSAILASIVVLFVIVAIAAGRFKIGSLSGASQL
jgi:parallel beta-helix repeat protein